MHVDSTHPVTRVSIDIKRIRTIVQRSTIVDEEAPPAPPPPPLYLLLLRASLAAGGVFYWAQPGKLTTYSL